MIEVASNPSKHRVWPLELIKCSNMVCFYNSTTQPNHLPNYTPPKFNMEPENDGFQKESPFPGINFQVPC